MPTPFRTLLALAALLTAASACDSPVEPGDLAGTYALVQVNGAPLPAVTFEEPHLRIERLSDVLQLKTDGTGRQVVQLRTTHPATGKPPEVETVTWELGFAARDARVEISYFCPPNALCIAGPHLTGRLEGQVLLLAERPDMGGHRFRYRRVTP